MKEEEAPTVREAALPTPALSPSQMPSTDTNISSGVHMNEDLAGLFTENITAKIYRTAVQHLLSGGAPKAKLFQNTIPPPQECLPKGFPEHVPQAGEDAGQYELRDPEFWTCGFFPGTIHAIYERLVKFPSAAALRQDGPSTSQVRSDMLSLCNLWAEPLHAMADRKDTHDVGFIIMPALQRSWELTGNTRSLESIIRAAKSLASRYVPGARSIRSWDARVQKNIQITCQCENVLLIIDSMCNLDLLYYAAAHAQVEEGAELFRIATEHASTLMRTHLRPEATPSSVAGNAYRGQWYSTHHVVNVDPKTGEVKQPFTAQGYSDTSTWARGQAWGILGYAQTYMWTKDDKFLRASCGLAEYFLYRMETSPLIAAVAARVNGQGNPGRHVPQWDFDAPADDPAEATRDSSAASIAANGLLIISQALAGRGDDRLAARFRTAATDVVRDLLDFALAPERARLVGGSGEIEVEDEVPGQHFEAIMKYGTVNNNRHAMRRYADHGIVYGDYYLVEFGNRLLRMGLL